ncbi:hypothetical protein AGMMS50239_22990 [Bacteroidia bacterium]|nr:hypothetical protein FACS1894207_3980 [Bacteroidia bacterium]GHT64732.1 hypothetical protein AGMMS50239_22990 [Bacteroidia bacterium]
MIQRIQSVYLFIVFLLMAVLFFLPASGNIGVDIWSFFCALTGVAALGLIFAYKKRKRQMSASLFLVLLLLLFFATNLPAVCKFELSVSYFILFIPLVAAGFAFAAYRAIKKDEKLVRSLDRLR